MKIGIIGCGAITCFRHAPECDSNPDIEIAGFFDLVENRASELAGRYGGRVYKNYEDMLNDKEVDGVIVCTSNSTHAEVTIKSLQAGKHVLCEKPLATIVEDGIAMDKAAKDAGKLLMIAQNQRMDAAHVKAKELISSGVLGKVIFFKSEFSHSGPENWGVDKTKNTWFFNKNSAILGAMGDLGVHKIDLVRWMLEEDFENVSAIVGAFDKKDADGNPISVDDNAICLLTTKNGIVGTVTASWSNYGLLDNSTKIYCTNGVIKINEAPQCGVEVVWKNGETVSYKLPAQTRSGIVDAFVDAVVKGKESPISAGDAVKTLKVIFAALKASESGIKVPIEY